MIRVVIYKNSEGIYKGFRSLGHADHGAYGSDIVCSAVSVLMINTVNAIESLTKDSLRVEENEAEGRLTVRFGRSLSDDARLLMDAMVLGLKMIQREYKNSIHLKFREV